MADRDRGIVDEANLVARVREGDAAAFALLLERHEGIARHLAERWLPVALRRKVSVSDVLQEARLVAHQRFRDFEARGDDAFRNWFLRILRLKAKEAVRHHRGTAKRSTDREVTRGLRKETHQFAARDPSPSEHALAAELSVQVRLALQELPPDYREILRLTREQRLPLAAVAERMGRTLEAAKKLNGRALARFTEALARHRGE
jgi:RNA polymerase sigma-70 factor (ECF subfamily)